MTLNPSALDLLSQVKSIIEKHELTIATQAERIVFLESEVARLQEAISSRDSVRESPAKDKSKVIHRRNTNPENSCLLERTPSNREKDAKENSTSIIRRSSSLHRKQFEEGDIEQATYELSSDLLEKQIEVLRKFYGGAETAEKAARIIQEAYRTYRMKVNFRKIRKSKTRRLTLENKLHVSEPEEEEKCPVEVVELGIEHSIDQKSPTESSNENIETFDKLYETDINPSGNIGYDNEEEPLTPKAEGSNFEGMTQQQVAAKILSEIAVPGIISGNESVRKRKKKRRHGYETVVLPPKGKEEVVGNGAAKSSSDTGKSGDGGDTSPSQKSGAGSIKSQNSDSPSVKRVGSELSLVSCDNEMDGESMRSSDTASIASGQSEFSNNLMSDSYQRRSTLSTRGSWHIDSNNDVMRKRLYRMGLNVFNKKPEKGIEYLVEHSFISRTAPAVATFLLNRKGLSRQMVGEYLGNMQKRFNQDVLDAVCELMDFSGLDIDEALRNFQSQIKVQGEAQKVERLVEAFSQRYCTCNPKLAESLKNPDSIFILAFAIIMLNTDLHSPNMKHEKRMSEEDFVRNLRGVDNGDDLDENMLRNVYHRIREDELKTDDDHVTQVLNVEKNIVGKKPVLAVPHRRLVCYCRLSQVTDPAKPQKIGLHQRAVFLFNDLLLVTKLIQKKKNCSTYGYKMSLPLQGMNVLLFETTYYLFGIRLINTLDNKVLVTFNAPNEHDRNKFVTDLRESINEVQQMENYRIGAELERAHLPVDSRGTLTKESKSLSTSMHNLNNASSTPIFVNERPASLYSLSQPAVNKNGNVNNNKSESFLSNPKRLFNQNHNNSKSETTLSGSFFRGKKGTNSPNSQQRKTQTETPPTITLTLSEV